jgi:hypothetical protein
MLWFKKYIFSELHYKTSKWLLPFVVPLTESSMDELSSLVLSCKGELFGWLSNDDWLSVKVGTSISLKKRKYKCQ